MSNLIWHGDFFFTHELNAIMQHVVAKLGFTYQGMVMMPVAHGERKAYQLILD